EGIVELNKYNYVARGSTNSAGYGSTILSQYDTWIWSQITSAFNGPDGEFAYAFITPAPMTNTDNPYSYRGMGAIVHSPYLIAALITPNMNGAYAPLVIAPTAAVGNNYVNYQLQSTADGM